MGVPTAVLFDFGDTLFHRSGGSDAILRAAEALGGSASEAAAAQLWATIQARARTPEEIARGRDLSAEAHRRCWLDLYRDADVVAPGMAEALYDFEMDPANWVPFPEATEVVGRLHAAGVAIGVVSDTGWDIRPVFARHGLDCLVDQFVLSYEIGAAKPKPTVFRAACDRLGVAASETVMVGDNPVTDGGAVDAGMACLVVPPPGARDHEPLRLLLPLFDIAGSELSIRAVLFDWRGTLVADPQDDWWVRRALTSIGRDPSPAEINEIVRGLAEAAELDEIKRAFLTADCSAELHRAASRAYFTAAGLDPEVSRALYELDFKPESHPIGADVAEVLGVLQDRGVKTAVVSDIHFDLRPEFEATGLGGLVDAYALSFEHGVQKPNSELFRVALERLGVSPEQTLMVGDRAGRDGAAVEIGIVTLLVPTRRRAVERRLDLLPSLVGPGVPS